MESGAHGSRALLGLHREPRPRAGASFVGSSRVAEEQRRVRQERAWQGVDARGVVEAITCYGQCALVGRTWKGNDAVSSPRACEDRPDALDAQLVSREGQREEEASLMGCHAGAVPA